MIRRVLEVILLFWLMSWQAHAVQPVVPSYALDGRAELPINDVVFLEDSRHRLNIDTVRQRDLEWEGHEGGSFSRGYSDSTWWLRFDIDNNSSQPQKRLLQVSYPILDQVDAYILSGDELVAHFRLGDRYPFATRPIESRQFVVPLEWQPEQKLSVYYRVRTSSSVEVPIRLWDAEEYAVFQAKDGVINGFYYGAMLVIVIYNLLIFLMLWDRSYFYYVGFVLSIPLLSSCLSGDAFRFLWPNATLWNDHALPIFIGTSVLFGSLFTREFLRVKQISAFWYCAITTLAALGGIGMMAAFILPYKYVIAYLLPLVIVHCVTDLVVGVIAWQRGISSARFYCIGWAVFLMSCLIVVLNKLAFIPSGWFTEYSLRFGSIAEAVLLSFALANKIGVEKKLRYEAQTALLDTSRRMNQELEYRVQERTEKLEMANARLRELSDTDELTGLKNRRFLDKVASEEWVRSRRHQHSMAFLMADIDFFKRVNDTYGHQDGDVCLKAVARKLTEGLRCPTDMVVRYGGEEFCVLLPVTDVIGARTVAERMRELVEKMDIMAGSGTIRLTVSIGVYAAIPSAERTIEYMIKCADSALYDAKRSGRNRVAVYRENDTNKVTKLPSNNNNTTKPS